MGSLRLAIACVAGLLVLVSIPPVRRRLPGLRRLPTRFDLLLWVAFVSLCLAALASVRTSRSTELSKAVARAAVEVGGQSINSWLAPAVHWVSVREPGVALATAGLAGLGWIVVAARTASVFGRALEPRPHLIDWWVVKPGPRSRPRIHVRPASLVETVVAPVALVDAHAAAMYLGVSRSTVYRWARAGRLRARGAGSQLRFSSGDLAALRETHSRHKRHA
jgi:excisionase family DNA binding protein